MGEQLDFFGSTQVPPQKATKCLFVAVRPDKNTTQRLTTLGAELRGSHGLRGKVLDAERFHITLQYINHYAEVPERLIQEISQACEAAARREAPFEVAFDRVMSFGRGQADRPMVLTADRGGDTNPELQKLHQSLWIELRKTRIQIKGSSVLTPHLTLLYDTRVLSEEPIQPVSWRVEEIDLVLSDQSEHKHHLLGRWRLGSS